MSLLTPLALIGALLAVPIILLYMLRLRRREVLVSSTFLWQQVLRDSEANTPWQRLRRNLLLFLQLLILALLVLALARPFVTVPAVSTGQIELLLDASASMNASDMPNGERRFEEARRQALSVVDTMGLADTMTVIRVADVAEVLMPATGDRNALRSAIRAAQPGNAEADWVAALTLAAADAVDPQNFSMVIISDGGLGEASGLPGVPGKVRYLPVGQSGDNLAISALATRSLPGQAPQLFAQVNNYGSRDADVIFDLRVDGELVNARRYTVPAGGALPLAIESLPENFQVIQAGLTRPAESTIPDYLALDDTAWTVSGDGGTRTALVMTTGNLFLEQALRSLPTIQAFRGDIARPLPARPYDLYILDGWLPSGGKLPDGDLLIINPLASTDLFSVGAPRPLSSGIRVARNDARMAFVDFADVSIRQYRPVQDSGWADALVATQDGDPLLLAGEVAGRRIAILTFDLRDSDLPLQITWPVLMANLVEWFTPRALIAESGGLRVGQTVALRPPLDATLVRVTLPDGTIRELPVDRETVAFAETDLPGVYRVDLLAGGSALQSGLFAVNPFSTSESNIAPAPSLSLSGNTVAAAARDEVGQQELWPWVALAALAVLLIEWIVYQRRMQVRTVFRPALGRRVQGTAS